MLTYTPEVLESSATNAALFLHTSCTCCIKECQAHRETPCDNLGLQTECGRSTKAALWDPGVGEGTAITWRSALLSLHSRLSLQWHKRDTQRMHALHSDASTAGAHRTTATAGSANSAAQPSRTRSKKERSHLAAAIVLSSGTCRASAARSPAAIAAAPRCCANSVSKDRAWVWKPINLCHVEASALVL